MSILQIVIALIVLGVLIFVHELGHFITAKMAKMPVSDFSLGMGPSVFSFERKGTAYSLRVFPIGGSCSIEGMELDSDKEDGFNSKSPAARIIVLAAGVFMNFLLAITLLFLSSLLIGQYIRNPDPVIGETLPTSHASMVLSPGDRILRINGETITLWNDISPAVSKYAKEGARSLTLDVEGKDGPKTVEVELVRAPESVEYVIGILPRYTRQRMGPGAAIVRSLTMSRNIFLNIFKGLGALVSGKVKKEEVSGPIGIIQAIGVASGEGFGMLIFFAAMLSINLGIINLLPLPALDGGRIIFVILELMHIRINKKIEERVHYAGLFMLFALIFLITINDVVNIFKS